VLDVGCGSGEPMARYFIERGWQVTGIDLVEEMLRMCRERFPEGRWLRGDMTRLALGETFDAVLAWDSFFHLSCRQQREALTAFRQHAAPGGVLMFTSGTEEAEEIGG